jgi:hypothetical protein
VECGRGANLEDRSSPGTVAGLSGVLRNSPVQLAMVGGSIGQSYSGVSEHKFLKRPCFQVVAARDANGNAHAAVLGGELDVASGEERNQPASEYLIDST